MLQFLSIFLSKYQLKIKLLITIDLLIIESRCEFKVCVIKYKQNCKSFVFDKIIIYIKKPSWERKKRL